MRYTEAKDRSAEFLRLALGHMGRHEAAFNPITFTLWYEYVAGLNPRLALALDALVAAKTAIDDPTALRLFQEHVVPADEAAMRRISSELQRVMSDIAQSAWRTGDRAGLFEAATGGTVFLDELTEMSAAIQAKLLHVLQEGELRRVGSTQSTRVDVRVICATNQPLEPLVESGRFREDLYYRLAPFVIHLPPLREHREDIALLAGHFLAEFEQRHGGEARSLAGSAIAALEQAPWPGNVRQLQHLMERLAITAAPNGSIGLSQVREALNVPTPRTKQQASEGTRKAGESLDEALQRIERAMVMEALESTRFVITDAAEKLGVNRSTLSRRLSRLGIKLPTS